VSHEGFEHRDARPEPQPGAQAEHRTVAHFEPSHQAPAETPRQSKPYVVWSSAPGSGGGRGSSDE
jgi:hypothetical protein